MAVSYFSWFCNIYSVSPSCVSKCGLSVGTPSNVNWICRSLKKRLFFSMKFHLVTFFRCVIPCACTIQIQNAIVIYISFKLPPKSIRCYLQIFLPTPVRYSGEFIKLILYLVLYFFLVFWLEYYCICNSSIVWILLSLQPAKYTFLT